MRASLSVLIAILGLGLALPAAERVPERDPAVDGEPARLVETLRDVHPRLLFGPEDVPRLKAFYASAAGADFRQELEDYVKACKPPTPEQAEFLQDATDGQRQGYWRMPTVALHHLLTDDPESLQKAIGYIELLLALPHWETGKELDSGMSAANVMIGAGLMLDWLWHDLEPELRERFRAKCLQHARAMYHIGHLKQSKAVHYWQNDPANNHRWHRNAGLAACLLAAATGAEEEAWITTRLRDELDFIVRWLPEDGTSHESPGYMTFGISHLILAAQAADRCLGTEHLQHDFFKHVPRFKAQAFAPGFQKQFIYGDQGGTGVGKLGYDLSLYLLTGIHGLKAEQAVLDRIRAQEGAGWGWMGLIWYHPEASGGDAEALPSSDFFEDIGVLWSREHWGADGRALQFKCGPYGGYTLNRFRNQHGYHYINVAHDDPDANSFLLFTAGEFVAETDRYSERKQSANHNTILINHSGQLVAGHGERTTWTQPARGEVDMSTMAVVTACKLTPGIDLIEGEAGGAYIAVSNPKIGQPRPALERFRRALVHAKGRYVLVLDDIRAPEPVTISWLVQGPELTPVEGRERAWRLAKGEAACPFRIESDRNDALRLAIVDSPADTKKQQRLGFRQLRAEVESERLVLASAYDLYGRALDVALDTSDPERIVATLSGEGIADRWEWRPAAEPGATYRLSGSRDGTTLAELGPEDRPEP